MKKRLIDRVLRSKELAPRKQPFDVIDLDRSAPPGFGARIMPSGTITFILYCRFPGSTSPVRRALGQYGAISLADAREKARAWAAMIEKNLDPAAEARRLEQEAIEAQKRLEEEQRRAMANSVEAVLAAYLEAKSDLRTVKALGIELRREFKPWLLRPVQEISKADVMALIRGIKARGAPGQARAIYGCVKSFFNWVARNDYIATSPCLSIDGQTLVGHKQEATRVLEDHEIRALWNATGKLGYPAGSYFRMLLLTGLRRREASNATWAEFGDPERWVIEGRRMKNKPGKPLRPHLVPITPAIAVLLASLPRHNGDSYLFSFTAGKALVAFGRAKAALDAAMAEELAREGHPFKAFCIHDVRRTVRTKLSELKVPEHIGERIIAHTQPEIERRYNLYGYEGEKREGLERWHKALSEITRPPLRVIAA